MTPEVLFDRNKEKVLSYKVWLRNKCANITIQIFEYLRSLGTFWSTRPLLISKSRFSLTTRLYGRVRDEKLNGVGTTKYRWHRHFTLKMRKWGQCKLGRDMLERCYCLSHQYLLHMYARRRLRRINMPALAAADPQSLRPWTSRMMILETPPNEETKRHITALLDSSSPNQRFAILIHRYWIVGCRVHTN